MATAIPSLTAGGFVGTILAQDPAGQERRRRTMQQQKRVDTESDRQAKAEEPHAMAILPGVGPSLPTETLFETGLIASRLPMFLTHLEAMRTGPDGWEPPESDLHLTDKTI